MQILVFDPEFWIRAEFVVEFQSAAEGEHGGGSR